MRMLMQSLRISERLVSSSQCVPIEAASAALPKWSICSTQWRGVKTVPESPVTTGRQRLVILGSGWAAGRLLRDIDSSLYDYTVGLALLIILQSLTRHLYTWRRAPLCSFPSNWFGRTSALHVGHITTESHGLYAPVGQHLCWHIGMQSCCPLSHRHPTPLERSMGKSTPPESCQLVVDPFLATY